MVIRIIPPALPMHRLAPTHCSNVSESSVPLLMNVCAPAIAGHNAAIYNLADDGGRLFAMVTVSRLVHVSAMLVSVQLNF